MCVCVCLYTCQYLYTHIIAAFYTEVLCTSFTQTSTSNIPTYRKVYTCICVLYIKIRVYSPYSYVATLIMYMYFYISIYIYVVCA